MKHLKAYTIPFVGLKEGEHEFRHLIDNTFFSHFEYDDFNEVQVDLTIHLNKKSTFMEFLFHIRGFVNVDCDVTSEPYDQTVKADCKLIVKFGNEYNDDLEDILILPYGAYEVNLAQYIYELIVLAMPNKRVHPGVEDGSLKSDVLDKLAELSINKHNTSSQDDGIDTDPRWDKLKDFLTDK